MWPSCAANTRERIGASRGTRMQRGLGVHAKLPESSESRTELFAPTGDPGASETVSSNSRTSLGDER